MKIAIIGTGAMGSIYAALLASAGNDVIAVDGWPAHVAAMNANGLRVEGASGERTVKIKAFEQAPTLAQDLVIVAAKASQVPWAAEQAKNLVGANTTILTIQNGLGSADILADAIGKDRLAIGIAAAFGASIKAPGHAHHNGMEVIRIGAFAGLPMARAEEIAEVWRKAGFKTEAVSNIVAMQWEKLICNVAYSALAALTGMTVGEIMDDPEIGIVSRAAATEAWEIVKVRNVPINVPDPIAHVREFGKRVYKAKPSVLLDHEAKRPSEVDIINGAIPREAAKIGKTAPVNHTLTALTKQKERAFTR